MISKDLDWRNSAKDCAASLLQMTKQKWHVVRKGPTKAKEMFGTQRGERKTKRESKQDELAQRIAAKRLLIRIFQLLL